MSVNAPDASDTSEGVAFDPRRLGQPLSGSETPPAGPSAAPKSGPRRFVGSSIREVYARVRAELGADALILEQHSREGRIEVLAGTDAADSPARVDRDRIIARLREIGLGHAALSRLPPALHGCADVERAIGRLIACAPPPQPLCGRYRLLGPPGAGKTTALIKLAAARVLRYGRFGTLLVGTDRSRLAGCEQLATSAELLGIEYVECAERALSEVLDEWRHMQLVLIDAGGSRGDAPPPPVAGVSDLLTLPAVWQGAALRRLRRQFQDHPLEGLVVTQTDQAESLWECVNLLVEWSVPLCWIGQGSDLAAELDAPTDSTCLRALMTAFDRSALASIFAR
ncbi:MAG: hypothetical protein RIC56_21930 [Pseudomonadales bacterium]